MQALVPRVCGDEPVGRVDAGVVISRGFHVADSTSAGPVLALAAAVLAVAVAAVHGRVAVVRHQRGTLRLAGGFLRLCGRLADECKQADGTDAHAGRPRWPRAAALARRRCAEAGPATRPRDDPAEQRERHDHQPAGAGDDRRGCRNACGISAIGTFAGRPLCRAGRDSVLRILLGDEASCLRVANRDVVHSRGALGGDLRVDAAPAAANAKHPRPPRGVRVRKVHANCLGGSRVARGGRFSGTIEQMLDVVRDQAVVEGDRGAQFPPLVLQVHVGEAGVVGVDISPMGFEKCADDNICSPVAAGLGLLAPREGGAEDGDDAKGRGPAELSTWAHDPMVGWGRTHLKPLSAPRPREP